MKTFETFKNYIVTKAKELNACEEQFKKAYKSENYQELLKVITDNANWCYSNKLVNTEILANVPDEELVEANIYVNKQNVIQEEGLAYYYSSTSEHYDSSTSKHYDSSTSEHYGSSTSKHYDSSTSEHYDSSTSKHYDSSTSEHYGSSTSKHYDSSTSEHYDSSTSEHYGSSTSEHYDSSYATQYEIKKETVNCRAIVRERSTGNVYFKKDAFNIIEL
jgi:hypothetical protein